MMAKTLSKKKRRSVRKSAKRISPRRSRSIRRSTKKMSPRARSLAIAKRSLERAKSFGCKRGEILKKAYTTKRGVRVPAVCIKDRGAKGKGSKVIPMLKEGTLMGYSTKLSEMERKQILDMLMSKYEYATLIRKLNAIRTLLKRTSPIAARVIDTDMIYVQTTY